MATAASTRTTHRLTALFRNRADAEKAYQQVTDRGYTRDEVSLVMSDETRKRFHPEAAEKTQGDKAMEGAGVGGAIGTVTGGLIGAIAAIGTNLLIPGMGLVIAGPLAAGLAGAGAGGITGGLIGALVGTGLPESKAKDYEKGVKEGGIIISVEPRTEQEAEEIARDWRSCGATQIDRY